MKIPAGLICALTLGACGQAKDQGAIDAAFNAQFEKTARDSCVSAAAARGAALDRVQPYCDCFVGQFAGLTTQEKMALRPGSPKLTDAAALCRAKVQVDAE